MNKKVKKIAPTIVYSQLPQYGLGSWLQKNAGTIGTVVGAGLGSIIPGAGTALGASIGGSIGGMVQGKYNEGLAEDAQQQAQQQAQFAQQAQVRQAQAMNFAATNSQPQYGNVFACGGKIKAGGGPLKVYAKGGKIPQSKVAKWTNADGGLLNSTTGIEGMTIYNTGGTHQQNPKGGIRLGKLGSVEQDEVRVGNYIFSNRF